MSNSPLVSYIALSPNCSSRNGQPIDKISVHHMAGCLSLKTCGSIFADPARQASSNYGVDNDGDVALYVDESQRSWCSSNYANDSRAVTIEVANSSVGGDWPISSNAWHTLVDLCVDICKRNNIEQLNWTGDSSGNLTCHYMFAATSCPGPFLKSRMQALANEVNMILKDGTATAPPESYPLPYEPIPNGGYTEVGFGGVYKCHVDVLNVRDKPSLNGTVVAQYTEGQNVVLDNTYFIADGYVWGTYIAYSGARRYIAIGPHTGKVEPNDYLIKI